MGIARTMRSEKRTTSSVEASRAPGASTSTIRAIRSAAPDPDMATSHPPAVAARAIVVPTFPAPTIPKRRPAISALNTGRSSRGPRAHAGGGLLNRGFCEKFPHARNHLASVQLDGRHLLFVGYSPRGVSKVESAETQQAN